MMRLPTYIFLWLWLALSVCHAQSLCLEETKRQEILLGIPDHLLTAIALVESGRDDPNGSGRIAWPWTIGAQGQGHYLDDKSQAIERLNALKAQGARNIDVGCMQVNLLHHPQAFASPEQAFDPAANVAYAARFLKGLFQATGDWLVAASYYHSQTPHLAEAYKERLMRLWSPDGVEMAKRSLDPPLSPPPSREQALAAYVKNGDRLTKPPTALVIRLADEEKARRIAEAYRQARLVERHLRGLSPNRD